MGFLSGDIEFVEVSCNPITEATEDPPSISSRPAFVVCSRCGSVVYNDGEIRIKHIQWHGLNTIGLG